MEPNSSFQKINGKFKIPSMSKNHLWLRLEFLQISLKGFYSQNTGSGDAKLPGPIYSIRFLEKVGYKKTGPKEPVCILLKRLLLVI